MVGRYSYQGLYFAVNEHLGCFQFLTVTNSATGDAPIHVSWYKSGRISLGRLWKSEISGIQGMYIFSFSAAAAAAKSLQSCRTLCDPIDRSPPGSSVPGILQARTLEWVAIFFSNFSRHYQVTPPLSTLILFTILTGVLFPKCPAGGSISWWFLLFRLHSS